MPAQKSKEMWWRSEVDEFGFYLAILDRIRMHGSVDMNEICKLTGYGLTTARKHVRKMIREGHVRRADRIEEIYEYVDRKRVGFLRGSDQSHIRSEKVLI